MLWQFGELGYDVGINDPCRVCNKPILWNYQQDANRARLYNITSEIISLRVQNPTFNSDNFTYSLSNITKRINLDHSNFNAVVLGNFGVSTNNINPAFQNTGWWYEYFSGDSLNVSDPNALISLQAGEYRLYTTKKIEVQDIISVGENPLWKDGYLVYPNPSKDFIKIEFNGRGSASSKVSLRDISGRLVFEGVMEEVVGGEYLEIPVAEFKEGMYFLMLERDGQVHHESILVQ